MTSSSSPFPLILSSPSSLRCFRRATKYPASEHESAFSDASQTGVPPKYYWQTGDGSVTPSSLYWSRGVTKYPASSHESAFSYAPPTRSSPPPTRSSPKYYRRTNASSSSSSGLVSPIEVPTSPIFSGRVSPVEMPASRIFSGLVPPIEVPASPVVSNPNLCSECRGKLSKSDRRSSNSGFSTEAAASSRSHQYSTNSRFSMEVGPPSRSLDEVSLTHMRPRNCERRSRSSRYSRLKSRLEAAAYSKILKDLILIAMAFMIIMFAEYEFNEPPASTSSLEAFKSLEKEIQLLQVAIEDFFPKNNCQSLKIDGKVHQECDRNLLKEVRQQETEAHESKSTHSADTENNEPSSTYNENVTKFFHKNKTQYAANANHGTKSSDSSRPIDINAESSVTERQTLLQQKKKEYADILALAKSQQALASSQQALASSQLALATSQLALATSQLALATSQFEKLSIDLLE